MRHIAARGGGRAARGGRGRLIDYVFMKLAGFNDECSWLRIFARFHFWKSRNCRYATKKFFFLSLYFKIRKFIFHQSWSRWVKICGLKSSIEVQQPTVSGNLKKMFYSCLCTSFMSCYCVLTEKIDKNSSVVTIDHFPRLRVGSLLVSYGDSNVWPGGLLQATVTVIRFKSDPFAIGSAALLKRNKAAKASNLNRIRLSPDRPLVTNLVARMAQHCTL